MGHETRGKRSGSAWRPGVAAAFGAFMAMATLVATGAGTVPTESLWITGARILDARAGRYVAAAGVLVQGGRITGVFDQAQAPPGVPAGARHVDVSGATLVPGLGDMYAAASPDAAADADFYYAMALAHGVTSYRVVGARLPWAASERDRASSGDIVAPRMWVGGPRLDEQAPPGFASRKVTDAASARREVGEQAAFGAQWVSVSPATTPETCDAIVKAARASRLHVSAEIGAASGLELLRTGVDAIDRIGFLAKKRSAYEAQAASRPDYPRNDGDAADDYLWEHLPESDGQAVTPRVARRRVFIVPMLASFPGTLDARSLKQDAALAGVPARWRNDLLGRARPDTWAGTERATRAAQARGRLLRRLASAGIRMTTGVDVESRGYGIPGAGVHRELQLLVAAGFSPADAIRAATVNCADMVGAAASLGQIRKGFDADFIAVDGDPLRNVGDLLRIRLIVRGGEVLDRDDLLAQARRAGR